MDMNKNDLLGNEELEELRGGDFVPTSNDDLLKQKMPDWFDIQKFNRAKILFKEYFASIIFSHICGIFFLYYWTKITEVFNSTGNSSPNLIFSRYLKSLRYIIQFYEGDVFDVNDPAHKSLSIARSLHAKAGKFMSKRNDGVVYVSQWDMSIGQWCFIAPLLLFKSKVGLHNLSEDDYEAFIHSWRAIGYLLCIEDKNNICQGSYSEVISTCKMILEEECKVRVTEAHSSAVIMGKKVADVANKIEHFLTWGCISTYIHKLLNLPCPQIIGLLDWACYKIVYFAMLFIARYTITRHLLNGFIRWEIDLAEKKFKKQPVPKLLLVDEFIFVILLYLCMKKNLDIHNLLYLVILMHIIYINEPIMTITLFL